MKIFRQPFWKAQSSYIIAIIAIASVIFTFMGYFVTHSIWGCLISVFISCLMLLAQFTQYFYVVLMDDKLLIKNSIYTFWKKEYFYKDIAKVNIIRNRIKVKNMPSCGVPWPCMQVITKGSGKFSWQYVIDLVNEKDCDELINELRIKGILVETVSFDPMFPGRNRHEKRETGKHFDTCVKIFRQSLWNTNILKINFTFTAVITTLFAPVVLIATNSVWICLAFVLSGYALFPIYFRWYFYVILSTEKLIIQNGVYSSSRKEYLFREIAKVKITRGRNIYMQVFTKTQEQVPRRYCIDVVAPKDYKLLVDMIKAKGISVETENLERYLV